MNWLQRILILSVAVPAVAYLGDWAVVAGRGNPRSTVSIQQYYAIPHKGNKLEYVPAEPDNEECVKSLFPHGGNRPCWYVEGHTRRQIDM